MTDAEAKIWSRLRGNNLGVKIRREVPLGNYILDFYCTKAKLDIEIDGSQHYTEEGLHKDKKRTDHLHSQGVEVIRFSDVEALKDTDGVVETIYEKIQELLQPETPS